MNGVGPCSRMLTELCELFSALQTGGPSATPVRRMLRRPARGASASARAVRDGAEQVIKKAFDTLKHAVTRLSVIFHLLNILMQIIF